MGASGKWTRAWRAAPPHKHAARLVATLVLACGTAGTAFAGDWTITPLGEIQEIYTDNVLGTSTGKRPDFITTLAPGISVIGQSEYLQGKLDYSPTAYLYARTPSQNTLGQNLYTDGTATLAKDLAFFDLHAYASLQPTTPALTTGFAPISAANVLAPTTVPQNQLTQVTSVNASPYLARRFGGYGTGELRYSIANTNYSGGQSLLLPFAVSGSNVTTNEGTATFVTGDNFGRFVTRALLDTAQSSGSGVLDGASQNRAVAESQLPITREFAALVRLGYEDLDFSGTPAVRIDGAIWGAGFRFSPVPDGAVTALYGRRDGITSPYLSLNYALTPLTRIAAGYTEQLSTSSQEIEQNLALSDLDSAHQTVDSRTLLPLAIHNPLLGLQLSLFRVKRLSAAGYLDNKRDHFSLTGYREDDIVIAQPLPNPTQPLANTGVSLRATAVEFDWAHEVSPLTTARLSAGYAWVSLLPPFSVHERIVTAGASISYLFNSSLIGSATYAYFDRGADQAAYRVSSNVFLVDLRKTF